MSLLMFCHTTGVTFPEFLRVIDVGSGKVAITLSEQGLMSPVAKVTMTKLEAARMFRNAADTIENDIGAEDE